MGIGYGNGRFYLWIFHRDLFHDISYIIDCSCNNELSHLLNCVGL